MPNPWLSLWLSAANTWANAARGFWGAEMQRQQTRMMNDITKQVMEFWAGAWMFGAKQRPWMPPGERSRTKPRR